MDRAREFPVQHLAFSRKRVTVETLTDGGWVQTERLWTDSYTVDKTALGFSRIRSTWTRESPPGSTISFY